MADTQDMCDELSPDIINLLHLLRNYNMKETETCFHLEYQSLIHQTSPVNEDQCIRNSSNINDYFIVYSYISNYIFKSSYQIELIQFLFPLFVHLYLDLLEHNYINECQDFYKKFINSTFQSLHSEFFYQLKLISQSSKHISQLPLTSAFRTSRFFLRLSMTSCTELQNFINYTKNSTKSFLTSTQLSLLLSIFQQYLKIDINQQYFKPLNIVRFQTIEQVMTPIFVHINLANQIQFTRLYTGIFSETNNEINQRDLFLSHSQINSNHIPRLGPHQLPSICLFTLKTSKQLIINCMILSNDCHLLAIGFQSSEILICSLNSNKKLYSMKSGKELRNLLSNSFNQDHILDTKSSIQTTNQRLLIGHTKAIFTLAFEPIKQTYLLSGSQDCTIRLWHLSTWSCLVVYKIHFQPILNGKFNYSVFS